MKIKIFSTTLDWCSPTLHDQMGKTDMMEVEIDEWLINNPEIISKDIIQSSCSIGSGGSSHMLTIVFMYK